jgi:hypothetical protein
MIARDVAKAIGLPVEKWPGQCYGIASEMLRAGLIKDAEVLGVAQLRYGHWLGPVSDDCPVEGFKSGAPFQRHGWIEVPDRPSEGAECRCGHLIEAHFSEGPLIFPCDDEDCDCEEFEPLDPRELQCIIDPTRWVFEGVEPYIYVGRNDHYDMGGNELRAALRQPCPAYDSTAPRSKLAVWKYDRKAHQFVMAKMFGGAPGVTERMAAWLANAPLGDLGRFAAPIYRALIDAGHGAHIPIDNRHAVVGEE